MKKRFLIFIASFPLFSLIYSQNPIVPAGLYIADPSAHVWNDGKLYIYGSADESTDYYCSHKHHVLVTEDMQNWVVYYNRFSSRGENDEVPYSDKFLYAPDCMYKDGKYYLYYCQPDKEFAEGVALSDSPAGPFRDGRKMNVGKYSEIDPAVFIDDDGQAYYTWGQISAKIARLKSNMIEIDSTSIVDNLLTEKEHFFHEGGFLTKRQGIYYYIYAHIGRSDVPSCIGYATSNSPFGPFKYGGVIIDNDNSDPSNWNNHGSIAEFNGQWYVFYHRATHNSRMMRKACVEPIYFNEDGTIDEVEMTTQGAGPPLDCMVKLDAERACLLFGNVRIQAFGPADEELGGITNKDRVAYKYIDFSSAPNSVLVRVYPGEKPGKISFRTEMPWRNYLGTIDIPSLNEAGHSWILKGTSIKIPDGIKSLWVEFEGSEDDENFRLDWIRFTKK